MVGGCKEAQVRRLVFYTDALHVRRPSLDASITQTGRRMSLVKCNYDCDGFGSYIISQPDGKAVPLPHDGDQ